jgi:hypothetical protein
MRKKPSFKCFDKEARAHFQVENINFDINKNALRTFYKLKNFGKFKNNFTPCERHYWYYV